MPSRGESNPEEIIKSLSAFITDPASFYLSKQYLEIALLNKKFESLNEIISNYLIKKKINIREVEVKLRNEEIRREKAELEIRKNLENKIDDALEKANSCLNNIKCLGKVTPIVTKGEKPIKYKDLEKQYDKAGEKDPIEVIVSKIKNKYNEEIFINENNMNDYFLNIAKMRNRIKNVKLRNKALQNRSKNIKKLLNQNYIKSRKNYKADNMTDFTFYKMINFSYVDLLYKLISIINTELFQNLFIKIFYENSIQNSQNISFYGNDQPSDSYAKAPDIENLAHRNNPYGNININKNNKNSNESEYLMTLQDTFSFWYCLKFLLSLIENNKHLTNLQMIFNPVNQNALPKNKEFNYNSLNSIVKYNKSDLFGFVDNLKQVYYNKSTRKLYCDTTSKLLEENLSKYMKFLHERTNKPNPKMNEKEIFDKNFYTFYEHLLLNCKTNFLKLSYWQIEKDESQTNENETKNKHITANKKDVGNVFTKEFLKKIKNLYAIIVNNSNHSFSIFNKGC